MAITHTTTVSTGDTVASSLWNAEHTANDSEWDDAYTHSNLTSGNPHEIRGSPYLVVAASNVPQSVKDGAFLVCDGTDDQVQIQEAINEFADANQTGTVYLTGDFSISAAIGMRNRVALESINSNHGTIITIANGSDCNGIEIAHRESKGQTALTGIYIEGNKDNNAAGSGFVMPNYGIRVTNSGAGATTSTVQVTSSQIIFKRDGVADYTITLSDSIGTLISEIIDVVHGNNGWTITNATGGLPGAIFTAHCTTTPSSALAVVAATDTFTVNADLELGITYDYFFHQCMCLHPNDYCWWAPKGHSIHWQRCVAEYAGVDGFNIVGTIDGVRMAHCFSMANLNNGYTIDAILPIITGCRTRVNDGDGFYFPVQSAVVSGCYSHQDGGDGFSFGVASNDVVLTGCEVENSDRGYHVEGNYATITGCHSTNVVQHGIFVSGNGNYNTITGCTIKTSTSYGIYVAGTDNVISGNKVVANRGGAQQCFDNGVNNVWSGNSEECVFVERQTNATLTVAGSNSKAIYQSAHATNAITFQLPAAILGMEFSFAVGVDTKECRIQPASGESIAIDGAQQTADKYITANAINETITLKCIVPGQWEDYFKGGTWAAEA